MRLILIPAFLEGQLICADQLRRTEQILKRQISARQCFISCFEAGAEILKGKRDRRMNKQEVYDYLKNKNIWYEVTEHKAVFNMAELSQIDIPYPESDAKNLFVRDDKKRNYYLITVKGDKKVDLKEFRQQNSTRALSFASENDLMRILKLKAGSVTPLGLLNDDEIRVKFFIDEAFFESPGLIGVHPNDNTATIWLKTEDCIRMIKEHGNPVDIVKI